MKKIEKALKIYADFELACDEIAKEAQKYIDFDERVNCLYIQGDGLCLSIECEDDFDSLVCPVSNFFDYVKGKKTISFKELHDLCI